MPLKVSHLASMISPVGAIKQGYNLYKNVKDKGVKGVLSEYYDMSPQKYALDQQEAAAIRAEDREKAYNDPSAQMARLKAAGLNPHLVYGGGVSGASGTFTSRQPGAMQAPTAIGERALQLIQIGAGIANVSSQAALRATQAGVNVTRVGQMAIETDLLKQKYQFLQDVNPLLASSIHSKAKIDFTREGTAEAENAAAWQRFTNLMKSAKLMDQDGEIKEEVLRGKSIVNDLSHLEREWLSKGDFTAQKFWELFLLAIKKL